MKWVAWIVMAWASLFCSSMAQGQVWPQRPIKIIVPYAAGGNTDNQARLVSERLAAILGQPFVIENRAGAGGAIAANYVAKAPADGYTLFFTASSVVTLPLLQKVSFDPYLDFAPVSIAGANSLVIAIHRSVPATTLKEFIDYVKRRPGKLNYATGGNGSIGHLAAVMFNSRVGLDMVAIHYKGGSQAIVDLLGGQVQMYIGSPSELIQHANGGNIRLIAVTGENRTSEFPNLPAVAELYPGFHAGTWNGFLAPAATPKPIIATLAREIARVVAEPGVIERFKAIGVDPVGNTPAEFADRLRIDAPMWRDAINAAGIKPE